jgi:autotransporter passenger strand-loop-strand repeat protein
VTLIVSSGGTASDTTIASHGTEIVSAGGKIAGVTSFGKQGILSVAATIGIQLVTSGFRATDQLDLESFKFGSAEKLSFIENTAKTSGTLQITDGKLTAKVTLFGNYVAGGFHLAGDGAAGTAVTYAEPGSATNVLAATHT